jgi:prepilin-type N-terminal cleavage/methylation domain-containing protein
VKQSKFHGERGGRNGFTLVEILLVVLVLSFVAALALPKSDLAYQRVQLRNAASDIVYLIRYGQGRAAVDKRVLRLEFGEAFKSCWLVEAKATADGSSVDTTYERLSGRWSRTLSFPTEVAVESEGRTVDIRPDGSIEKVEIKVCAWQRCLFVVTGRQRGAVHVLDDAAE